jgi:hypothetical protein
MEDGNGVPAVVDPFGTIFSLKIDPDRAAVAVTIVTVGAEG